MATAILIIAGIGMVAAVALAVADRYLSVKEDPRIGMVTAELPGLLVLQALRVRNLPRRYLERLTRQPTARYRRMA